MPVFDLTPLSVPVGFWQVGTGGALSAAAWSTAGILFYTPNETFTDITSSGAVAGVTAINTFGVPTIAANSASSYAIPATLYIAGIPIAGVNVTFSGQAYALYTNGAVYINGTVNVSSFMRFGSIFTIYKNISTVGFGVSPIFGEGLNVSLNTVSTAICSYTPTSGGGQFFCIKWALSCATASTPTLQVTYTDPNAGAQTVTLYNSAMGNNSVQSGTFNINATSATAIAVTGSDSVALGDIFATATIQELI